MSQLKTARESNALTIMPLPVRIPASWYDVLPRVLTLISRSPEQTKFCITEETSQIFLQRWKQALIKRDGPFVWLHLGGVACYEVVPNFVKGVKEKILSRDREIKDKGGSKALIQHWRTCIEEFKALDDSAVLRGREEMLRLLQPEMWHEGLGRAWSFASERAHINFGRIRPTVQRWISQHENQCNLDKPFSGRFPKNIVPTMGAPVRPSSSSKKQA